MRPRRLLLTLLLVLALLAGSGGTALAQEQQEPSTSPTPTQPPVTLPPEQPNQEPERNNSFGGEFEHEEKAGDGLAEAHAWGTEEMASDDSGVVRTGLRSWIDDCTFTVVDAQYIVDRVYLGDQSRLVDPLIDGVRTDAFGVEYWIVRCSDAANPRDWDPWTRGGYFTHYPVGGSPTWNVIELVRRSAYDSVPLVVFRPEMSPPGTADHAAITQLENWLFVDPARWVRVSATASIPGLSVTVTATPVRNTWSGFDEPETVVCDVNVPYSEGMTEHPCGAYFTNKDPHTVRLVTDWEAAYVCRPVVAGCTGGRLPSQVTVSELVPVITSVVPVLTR